MYKLIIEDDEGKTIVVPLIRSEISIGRDEGNAIRLTERNISRRHAKLAIKEGQIAIEDLQSYNGIFVNGTPIAARADLKPGDILEIGDYQMHIKEEKRDATPAAKPSLPPAEAKDASPPPLPPPKEIDSPVCLLWINSHLEAQRWPLEKSEISIGRTAENTIAIDHPSVSRQHAKVVRQGGFYKILDQESANGVRVNGDDYEICDLRLGDIIELGTVRLLFSMQDAPAEIRIHLPGEDDLPASSSSSLPAVAPSSARVFVLGGVLAAVLVVCIAVVVLFLVFKPKSSSRPSHLGASNPLVRVPSTSPSERDPLPKATPEESHKRAEDAFQQQNYDQALSLLQEILAAKPSWKDAELLKSKVLLEQKNQLLLNQSLECQEKKQWEEAWQLLLQIGPNSRYSQKVEDEKKTVLPKFLADLVAQVKKALDEKKTNEALQINARILELKSDHEEASSLQEQINQLLLPTKRPRSRRQDTKAPEEPPPRKSPSDAPPSRLRKKATPESCDELKKLERFKSALACYRQLLKLPDAPASAHLNIGSILARNGSCNDPTRSSYKPDTCSEALSHYRRYIEMEPTSEQARRLKKMLDAPPPRPSQTPPQPR